MNRQKVRVKHPATGEEVDTDVVDIEDIRERPTLVKLADGTVLRIKLDVVDVSRFDGLWASDGNPVYNVRTGSVISVLEAPDNLKKPGD